MSVSIEQYKERCYPIPVMKTTDIKKVRTSYKQLNANKIWINAQISRKTQLADSGVENMNLPKP